MYIYTIFVKYNSIPFVQMKSDTYFHWQALKHFSGKICNTFNDGDQIEPKEKWWLFSPFFSSRQVCVCVVSNDYDPITPPLSKAHGTSKKEGRKVVRVRGQRELGKNSIFWTSKAVALMNCRPSMVACRGPSKDQAVNIPTWGPMSPHPPS